MFNNFKCKVLGLPLLGLMIILSPWSFSWAKYVAYESVTNQERDWMAIVFACAGDKVPAVLMQNGTPGKNTAKSSCEGSSRHSGPCPVPQLCPCSNYSSYNKCTGNTPEVTLGNPGRQNAAIFPACLLVCYCFQQHSGWNGICSKKFVYLSVYSHCARINICEIRALVTAD